MQNRSIAVPVGLGFVSTAIVLFANAIIEARFHFNLMGFWVNFILPGGALLWGFVAALGFFQGARIAKYPANGRLLLIMMITALLALPAHHLLRYYTLSTGGIAASDVMSFSSYLQFTLTDASISSRIGGGTTFELGRGGILLALGEVLGFVGGMGGGYRLLKRVPHCDKCQNYFTTIFSRKISFANLDDMLGFLGTLPDDPRGRVRAAKNCDYVNPNMITKKGTYHWESKHRQCNGCYDQIITESAILSDNGHHFDDRFARVFHLEDAIANPPVTTAPPPAPVRTFGRKLA